MATPGVLTPLRDEPLLAARAPCLTRERKQAREHDAELDKLTVSARTAVVLAKKLTASELQDCVDALLREAKAGKRQAAKRCSSWSSWPSPPQTSTPAHPRVCHYVT
jgi:hypothetical protein